MKPTALNLSMTNILYGARDARHSISVYLQASLVGLHVKYLLHHGGTCAREFMPVMGNVTNSTHGIISNLSGMKHR